MDLLCVKSRCSCLVLLFSLALVTMAMAGFNGSPTNPTDGEIESAIERRLEMDARIGAGTLGATVENGHVVLTGTANTIKTKKLTAKIASSVYGVKSIVNDVRVSPSMTDTQKITYAVKQHLLNQDLLLSNNIAVRVDEGVVFLEGTVNTRDQRKLAGRAAEAVAGVVEVDNLLQVVEAPRSDEAIKKDIIQYLLYSPLADNQDIDVEVENGVVTLKGEVPHLAYRDALAIDIENIHGVDEVKTGYLIPEGLAASDRDNTRRAAR